MPWTSPADAVVDEIAWAPPEDAWLERQQIVEGEPDAWLERQQIVEGEPDAWLERQQIVEGPTEGKLGPQQGGPEQPGGYPEPKTQEEVDAISPGAYYISPSGTVEQKEVNRGETREQSSARWRRMSAEYSAEAEATSSIPSIPRESFYGAARTGANLMSTVTRPFSKNMADDFARIGGEIDVEAAAVRKDDWFPEFSRHYYGAFQSLTQAGVMAPGGLTGMAVGFGITEGNQALYDAEQAGVTGNDRLKYAAVQGAIEGTIMQVFNKLKIPGMEGFVQKLASGTMTKIGKEFLKATAQEIPEELLTELGHALAEVEWGINPNAMNQDELFPRMYDTVVQTVLTLGLASGAAKVTQSSQGLEMIEVSERIRASQVASRLTRLNEILSKGYVSEEEGLKEGIKGKTRPKRLANAKAEIKKLEQEIQDAEAVLSTEEEIREEEGGPDVRGAREGQVRPEPKVEVAPAREVQPESVTETRERIQQARDRGDLTMREVDDGTEAYRGTGGIASGARGSGFQVAFRDTETGEIAVPMVDLGGGRTSPSGVHVFDGLPDSFATERDEHGDPIAVKSSVEAGFVKDGQFYTREEAAQAVSEQQAVTEEPSSPTETKVPPPEVETDKFGSPIPAATVEARKDFLKKAIPGFTFKHSSYPGSEFQILDDGTVFETTTKRKMNTAAAMAESLKPGAVTEVTAAKKVPPQEATVEAPATGKKSKEVETTRKAEETPPLAPDADWNSVKSKAKKLGIPIKGKKVDLIAEVNSKLLEADDRQKRTLSPEQAGEQNPTMSGSEAPSSASEAAPETQAEAPQLRDVTSRRLGEVRESRGSERNYLTTYTKKKPGSPLNKTEQSVMDALGEGLGIGYISNALTYAKELDQFSKPQRKALLSLLDRGELKIEDRVTAEGNDEWIVPAKPNEAAAEGTMSPSETPKTKQRGVSGEASKPTERPDSEFGRDVSGILGITPVPLSGQQSGIGKSVRHFFQRFFTSRGELSAEVYNSKIRRDGRVAKEMNALRFVATDFSRSVRKALGGKELTQADAEAMNAVLRGEEDLSTVPEEVRAPIQAMRDHIDSLSRRLISEGVAQGDLVGIIDENMGVYTTRSYRVFDDPKWREKVPDGVRNRAIAAVRDMHPEKSDADIIGLVESLIFRGAADAPVALLKGSKLGSKDLSTFMRRREVPQWLRELWGEYKDAGVNYARSVFKMSHLLANQQFLNEVRDAGLGKWLRTQEEGPTVNEFGELITKIAADSSSVMEPLNGLYTTPEIKKAFERIDSPGAMPKWLRVIMSVNYAVKYGKTVGSMMTHIRNLVSNTGFAVANGHWRLDKAGKAIWATATGTFQLPDAEFREYYKRLAELGLVGEDVRAGELKDSLRDASQADIDEFLYNREARHAKKAVKAGRAGLRFFSSLYQAEDGVWKIYAWENEKARYAKAHPEWSQEQLEERAAGIVRNTYPTYSKIPAAIKGLRRFPLAGTFVSFPSEVVRTTFHTLKLGMEEMQAPETRAIGAQRLAGTVVAIGGLSVLSHAMMAMFGIGDDDDDDIRWFVPPWQENSRFIFTAKPKDAVYSFVDMGYSDPHAYLTDSVVAFMRGDNWVDSLGKATGEFLRPFASEEILAKALMDVRDNKDQKVYNPKDEVGEQAKGIVEYMWKKALEPGTISSLRRIQTAAEGTDPSKSAVTEVMALTTGQRLQKIDVEHSLGFRVRDFAKALTDIQRISRKTATSRGTATGEMVATDLARMEKLRLAEFSEMQRIAGAARRLGVPSKNIRAILKDELPDNVAKEILTGDYSPYEMSRQTVEQMMAAKPDEFTERFSAWHGDELPQAIKRFAMPKLGNLPTKPRKGQTVEEYRKAISDTKRQLDILGVSHQEARRLLLGYYNSKRGGIFERGTGDLKMSFMLRVRRLNQIYGVSP